VSKKPGFLFVLLFFFNFADAQILENFDDGNFINNHLWLGDTGDFIVNDKLELQSNNLNANSTFYLSAKNKLAASTQWQFWIRLAFNPSSANYVDFYLTASTENLTQDLTVGYFIRIGNTEDEISLFRKDKNGIITKIIDGENGILNSSNNILKIKVTRNKSDEWQLFRDASGTGNLYINEGKSFDSTYRSSEYFGILIKQSSSGFFKKHFFDDIEIKEFIRDTIAPKILSATAISDTKVDVLFNEPVDKKSAELFSNYTANNGLGMPSELILDAANPALVHLTFTNSFTNGIGYTLIVKNVKDLEGNVITNETSVFSFYSPQQYDVIIDEIFPDPNPQVKLPLLKFIELKNVSAFPINLQNWKLIDGTFTAKLPFYNLPVDSFVIICATNSVASYSTYGNTLGVANFPSLNIGGDDIILKTADDKTIHAVQYDLNSYKNELKKEGGWSLEMIDTKEPCFGSSNWKASNDANGGTPGRKNSVDGTNNDEDSPKLLRAFVSHDNTVSLVFNEPVDSLKAATITNYSFDKNLSAINAVTVSPFFNEVSITLNKSLETGIIYTITANNIPDCSDNVIQQKNSASFGMEEDADSLDIVVNEILFDPREGGSEYVEIYNRSSKIIDLSKVYIANRNSSNAVSNIKQLSAKKLDLFPAEFMVLTEDRAAVKDQYITLNPDVFLQLSSMPSLPNDFGAVIILNNQGNIIDEVRYSEKWHFPLIYNSKGVSLERIDYNAPSTQSNFHSAATSVGYGTPGYKNSQFNVNEELRGDVTVMPQIFSPDNDGTDDFVTINYNFPSAGYVANITIFDASGRPIRYLQKNSLSGIKGYYRWDGLDEKNKKLPQGIYIIYTEIFNTDGKRKSFKNSVVLARRF
jgi:hypothetical protein